MSAATMTRPEPPSTPTPKYAEKRPLFGRFNRFLPVLLVLAGIMILLYPIAATQYNNFKQRQFSDQYSNEVAQLPDTRLGPELDAARDYNSRLSGVPILDPWLLKVSQDPGSEPYMDYASQLDLTNVMARVRVPSAKIDVPVYHGTTDDVLAKGAGHLYGTSLPVGGPGTHAVLTSHTGLPNATLFDHLIDVKEGDLILVEVLGETLAYRVDQIKIVLPNEIGDLKAEPGEDHLTLFTCTPYAINTHRLLVRGERVDYTPEIAEIAEQPKPSPFQMETWMWWLLAGVAVGVVVLVIIIRRNRRGSVKAGGRAARSLPTAEP